MIKSDYMQLRKQVKAEGLLTKSNSHAATALIVETVLVGLSLYALTLVEPFGLFYWLIQISMGIAMFRFFALLHDSGHRALFTTQRANSAAGFFCSLFCLMPYTSWRDLHLLHHRWVGVIDKDPTQAGLMKLKEASPLKKNLFRAVWWLLIPIPSMQLILSVFWAQPFRNVGIKRRRDRAFGLLSLALTTAPHLTFIALFGLMNYAIYLLPAVLIYLLWFEAVNFTHHSGIFPFTSKSHPDPIPLHEQDSVSRSSTFHPIISTILSYNFNYHTEHHYFPTVSWHNLPKVKALVDQIENKTDYQDVPFLGFSAQLRAKDPVEIYINALPTVLPEIPSVKTAVH